MDGCYVVGLTGRSGCGKSTVASHFAAQGVPVLDGDAAAREVVQPGSPTLAKLAQAFGADVLDEHGALQRDVLAARAFAAPAAARRLTNITHPAIVRLLLDGVRAAHRAGAPLVVVDGAVIVGARFQKHCDAIVVVTAPLRESISRIILRDGISKEAAHRRLAAQLPEETLVAAADFVLENNTSPAALLQHADEVLAQLRLRAAQKAAQELQQAAQPKP